MKTAATLRRPSVRFVLIVAILATIAPWTSGAEAAVTEVRSIDGFADADGTAWRVHDVEVTTRGRLVATLNWDNSAADLKLLMRPLTGTLAAVTSANSVRRWRATSASRSAPHCA